MDATEPATLFQALLLALVAGGLVLALLANVLWPVGGRWREGERTIELTQWLCFVGGQSQVEGGWQVYRGLSAFGFVWLRRYDGGRLHLLALGFNAEQAAQLSGRAMARLVLRRGGTELAGRFVGRHFRFRGRGRIEAAWQEGAARRWIREAAIAP